MKFWKRLNQSGLGVTEVLIALGIGTAVVGSASYFAIEAFKSDKNEEFSLWLDQRRSEILYTLQNESGWEDIKKNNEGIDCAETAPELCQTLQQPNSLELTLGNQKLIGSDPRLGITPEGQFCYSFDALKGNRNCPVGMELKWRIVCGSDECKDAQPNVSVKFSHSTGSGLKLNLNTYNINFFKDSRMQTMNDVCEGLGGTFKSGKCEFNPNSCDPSNSLGLGATYPMGFDAAGKVICSSPDAGACSSNDYLAGFNPDGSVKCAPRCTAAGTPVNCVGSWGACNSGTQTYTVSTPASNGGAACAAANGATQACSAPPTCDKCDHLGNECVGAVYRAAGTNGPGCYVSAGMLNGVCTVYAGDEEYLGAAQCP